MKAFPNVLFRGHSDNESESKTKYEKFPRLLLIALVFVTITKLVLVSSQVLIFFPADDFFFVNLANNIIGGSWLGAYDQFTLAKGPFYPLYIAITFFAGIPLLISQQLLYIGACATFVIAVRGLFKKPATLFVIYLLLLFNPMSFSNPFMTRVLREGIYASLTIFTISCSIGLLLQYDRSFKKFALWSTGLGFSLSFLSLTREEGIWILPSVIIIVGFAMLTIWRAQPEDRTRRLFLCVLPFIIWFFLLGTVASLNKARYGVFRITDFKSRSFISALHSLMRVKPTEWKPMLPVPAEVRERVYKVSPAFAEIKPFLDGEFTKSNRSFSCRVIHICDDVGGGFFMWAFRASVARAGFYKSAKDADNYYMKLVSEIKAACADKKLDCLPAKTSISIVPPLNAYYLRKGLKAFTQGFVYLTRFDGFNLRKKNWRRGWLPETRMLYNDITGEQTAPLVTERSLIVLSGWAFHPDYPIGLSIRTKDGDMIPAWIKTIKSPGLYNRYKRKGIISENSKKARFVIRTFCDDCYLYVSQSGTLIERIPLKEIIKRRRLTKQSLASSYYAEFRFVSRKAQLENRLWMANLKGNVLKTIAAFYQYIMPFLFILALVIQILGTLQILRKKVTVPYVINIALLMAIFLRLSILSIIDITLFPAIHSVNYLSPAHPLLLMIIIFSLLDWKTVIPRRKRSMVK